MSEPTVANPNTNATEEEVVVVVAPENGEEEDQPHLTASMVEEEKHLKEESDAKYEMEQQAIHDSEVCVCAWGPGKCACFQVLFQEGRVCGVSFKTYHVRTLSLFGSFSPQCCMYPACPCVCGGHCESAVVMPSKE